MHAEHLVNACRGRHCSRKTLLKEDIAQGPKTEDQAPAHKSNIGAEEVFDEKKSRPRSGETIQNWVVWSLVLVVGPWSSVFGP